MSLWEALRRAYAIDIDIQRALCGDPGVELAHRASGGISGIGKKGLSLPRSFLIQPLKTLLGEIDLSSYLEPLWGILGNGDRDAFDGSQVLGDVFATVAITSGGPRG